MDSLWPPLAPQHPGRGLAQDLGAIDQNTVVGRGRPTWLPLRMTRDTRERPVVAGVAPRLSELRRGTGGVCSPSSFCNSFAIAATTVDGIYRSNSGPIFAARFTQDYKKRGSIPRVMKLNGTKSCRIDAGAGFRAVGRGCEVSVPRSGTSLCGRKMRHCLQFRTGC